MEEKIFASVSKPRAEVKVKLVGVDEPHRYFDNPWFIILAIMISLFLIMMITCACLKKKSRGEFHNCKRDCAIFFRLSYREKIEKKD